jgi:hypothetical protein
MVYHFKKRVDNLESKYETLADISKTLYKEIELIRNSHSSSMFLPPQFHTPDLQMNHPKTPHNNGNYDKYTSHVSYLHTDVTFISSLSSNPFDDLYKKIVISNDILESEPPFLDTEILDDDDIDEVDDETDNDGDIEDDDSFDNSDIEKDEDIDCTTINDDDIIEDIDRTIDPSQDNILENIMLDDFIINTNNYESTESIQVMKLEENEILEGSILTVEPENTENESVKMSKTALQKMNVQMLRTIAIRDGICEDPSKYKKLELINMIIEANNVNPNN